MNKIKRVEEVWASLEKNTAYYKSRPGFETSVDYELTAHALVDEGFGNVPQALAEFVEKLKEKARELYKVNLLSEKDIDETLQEFLGR